MKMINAAHASANPTLMPMLLRRSALGTRLDFAIGNLHAGTRGRTQAGLCWAGQTVFSLFILTQRFELVLAAGATGAAAGTGSRNRLARTRQHITHTHAHPHTHTCASVRADALCEEGLALLWREAWTWHLI